MTCTIDRWTAKSASSDSGRKVAVVGEGICRKSGVTLTLKHSDPGPNPDPKVLVLELDEKESVLGRDVMTPARVSFETTIGTEVVRVLIQSRSGDSRVAITE